MPCRCRTSGDAHARAQVRIAEIDASIALIQRVLLLLADGPVRADCVPPPHSEGLGWAESPRGSLFYAVHFGADGRLVARQDQVAVLLELAGVSRSPSTTAT